MPLQNRVNPFSDIIATPERGLLTGNRGILHNASRQLITTRWRTRAWIICTLTWRDVRRTPMSPRTWTELFFLDEATALAAGHRPCAYCRRAIYRDFLSRSGHTSAPSLDATLHTQRTQPAELAPFSSLPLAAMFATGSEAWLKCSPTAAQLWSFSGYAPPLEFAADTSVRPLTPALTRDILAAGFKPLLHPTAALAL